MDINQWDRRVAGHHRGCCRWLCPIFHAGYRPHPDSGFGAVRPSVAPPRPRRDIAQRNQYNWCNLGQEVGIRGIGCVEELRVWRLVRRPNAKRELART
jgi:hypothetical protein